MDSGSYADRFQHQRFNDFYSTVRGRIPPQDIDHSAKTTHNRKQSPAANTTSAAAVQRRQRGGAVDTPAGTSNAVSPAGWVHRGSAAAAMPAAVPAWPSSSSSSAVRQPAFDASPSTSRRPTTHHQQHQQRRAVDPYSNYGLNASAASSGLRGATGHLEWSGRVTSPDRGRRASNNGGPIGGGSPLCWVCEKECSAHGWCQVSSTLVHRIVFYPASLFTLCSTCGKAMSLAPGTSLVDVIARCHPTAATRSHSNAFVAFLREYMMLLESAYIDLEEAAARRGTTSSSPPSTGVVRHRNMGRKVTRDEVALLTPRIVDQLSTCIAEYLRDREALTLKESHLLMNEAAALQAHADANGFPPTDFRAAAGGGLSPEQKFLRSHPLLDPQTGQYRQSELAGPERHHQGAGDRSRVNFDDDEGPLPPITAADEDNVIVVNGRRYVLAGGGADNDSRATAAAATPGRQQQPHGRGPVHHTASSSSRDGHNTASDHHAAPSQRLLAAAEEFAAKENEHELERHEWHSEREEFKRHIAATENEIRVLRERLAVKDRESDTLVVRNTEMASRLATMDSSSTLQAHFALLSKVASHHANMAADAAAAKARLFGESAAAIVQTSIALGRQLRKTKDELEQTKLHVRQQQKMIEASRRAVMQAWSEKAGIAHPVTSTASSAASARAPAPWDPLAAGPAFTDSETTLF